MTAQTLRKLGRVLIRVALVWVGLLAIGALMIVISARAPDSPHVEPAVPVLVEEPRDVPRAALPASAQALSPASVRLQSNGPPTVNGLFYGDGDWDRYEFLAENPGRSALYYYLDTNTNILYAALVISTSFNDNVFGQQGVDTAYVDSAGWNNHNAKHLMNSDHSVWNLCCGSCGCWTWVQDYIYDVDGDRDPTEADWLSDPYGPDSTFGSPPTGFIASASSLQWNLNWHAIPTQPTNWWDVTLNGTRTTVDKWKSPDGGIADTVTDTVDNWPNNYSTYWEWEWPLVYEVSINLPTCCEGCSFTLWPVNGHNSPSKVGGVTDLPVYDWGDLPDTGAGTGVGNYQTYNTDLGPSHVISACEFGLRMGDIVDPETDGQPSGGAIDDDNTPGDLADDEDGVMIGDLLTTAGSEAQVGVYATNSTTVGAMLYGFIDWNGDGDFLDINETASVAVPDGSDNDWFILDFGTVPDYDVPPSYIYSRFRLSTDPAAAQPTGAAWDGEVEDYVIEPTLAIVRDFGAYKHGNRVVVQWSTASEVGTLGFYLSRLDESTGEYVQLNEELLPGLLHHPQGGTYRFVDEGAIPDGTFTYKLVEVELSGQKRTHGPFTVEATGHGEPVTGNYAAKGREISAEKRARIKASAEAKQAAEVVRAQRVGPKIKIVVSEAGLYYLDAQEIATVAGVRLNLVKEGIKRSRLQLSNQGQNVAYIAAPGNSGIYFYAEGIESIYSDENIYWLKQGQAVAMEVVQGQGPPPASAEQTFTDTIHLEEDQWAQPARFSDPQADYWLWKPILAGHPELGTVSFTVRTDGVGAGPAALAVHLLGYSDSPASLDHHVIASVNGREIGQGHWDGLAPYDLVIEGRAAVLNDGENTLQVTGVVDEGVPYSAFYVDSLVVTYPHHYRAVDNKLLLRGDGNAVVTVEGFGDPAIRVFDVTDPFKPKLVMATTKDQVGGNHRVSFVPSAPDALYLALTMDALSTPLSVYADAPSDLTNTANAADYLVLAPMELKEAAQALADYRQGRGLAAIVVDLEDIYDEFNDGIASPEAIKAFLTHAYHNWTQSPSIVVLAGEGTYDYKDNLGHGECVIPPLMVNTPHGLFASDNRFVDVAGDDGAPEMAIGRLPVATAEELLAFVGKTMAYEAASGAAWTRRVIMVADNPEPGLNFPADSDDVAGLLPPEYITHPISLSEDNFGEARSALLQRINDGTVLMNYIGHAGLDRLTDEGLLVTGDVDSLANGRRLPVATLMTCAAGQFAIPGYDVIGEALVLRNGGGAVAVWAPTGLSLNSQAKILDEAFFRAAFQRGEKVLGQAVLSALQEYAGYGEAPYMLDIYNLLGDPALEMK
jgi:hypothetical protein